MLSYATKCITISLPASEDPVRFGPVVTVKKWGFVFLKKHVMGSFLPYILSRGCSWHPHEWKYLV